MKNWNEIKPVVEQVLRRQRFSNSGDHYGERCFLTAYQIAVLVDKQDCSLKGTLPIGGKGEGGEENRSFTQQIAWHLSKAVNDNDYNGLLERQFLSTEGLDSFTFDGGKSPSSNELTMYRLS